MSAAAVGFGIGYGYGNWCGYGLPLFQLLALILFNDYCLLFRRILAAECGQRQYSTNPQYNLQLQLQLQSLQSLSPTTTTTTTDGLNSNGNGTTRTVWTTVWNGTSSGDNVSEFIIGGVKSRLGSWPWQVFIKYKSSVDQQYYICGGSLISPIHLLTAAHCAWSLVLDGSIVKLGTIDSGRQSTKGITRKIKAKYIHPKFMQSESLNPNQYFDIAILEMDEKVTYNKNIQPICLPFNDTKLIQSSGTVTGWGQYTTVVETSIILREAVVPFIDHERCSNIWMKMPTGAVQLRDSQLCAGARNRGTGQGDSGGPLQVRQNGIWYQVGITSFGENTNEGLFDQASFPGVYTRVSSYCNFIESRTRNMVKCSSNNIFHRQSSLAIFLLIFLLII